jgi:ABC-2 type transport system permease protein
MTGLPRLVRIELLKLHTSRSSYGMAAVAVLLTAFDAVLRGSRAGHGNTPSLSTAAGLTAIATLTGFAMVMATVLGAVVATGEYRNATATLTYLDCPRRGRVLLAKLVAACLAGLAFGALGAAVTTGVGLGFVAGHGEPVLLGVATLARYGAGAMLGAGSLAALGVTVGSLVRSQLPAVVGAVVWALFVESIVGGFFNAIDPYLPFTAASTLAGARLGGGEFGFSGGSSATALPFAAAAALVAALTALLAAAAARTTVRADIG